ncbi:MAG: RNA methyltransferase, partial [Rhodothermales bacterium]|nr:RNA methyltransferase [Rhodothermales bacterium]
MSRIIAGRNPVGEALSRCPDEIDKVYLQRGSTSPLLRSIASDAQRLGIGVQYVPRQRLDQLAGPARHQGVAAAVAEIAYLDLDDLLARLGPGLEDVKRRAPMVVVLDRIQDPHNFGAILRTAAAAGVEGVVTTVSNSAPMSPATVKASAGTAGFVPVARVRKMADALTQLKERGFWVIGLGAEATETIWGMDWNRPTVLVVGSEGE